MSLNDGESCEDEDEDEDEDRLLDRLFNKKLELYQFL